MLRVLFCLIWLCFSFFCLLNSGLSDYLIFKIKVNVDLDADSCSFSSAGYNNLEVAEYLLEHGADVNAQDKGGLIPLHNAASYGVSLNANALLQLAIALITTNTDSGEGG